MASARPQRANTPDVADQFRDAIAGCANSLNRSARVTGVDKARLSRFLRKERTLQLTAAAKLCTYLGLSLTGPAHDPRE